jgi:hypothetical protein
VGATVAIDFKNSDFFLRGACFGVLIIAREDKINEQQGKKVDIERSRYPF